MCRLCELVRERGQAYSNKMSASIAASVACMPVSSGPFFSNFLGEGEPPEKYPAIDYPLFEPKAAYASPVKYFQETWLEKAQLPCNWTHASTRAIGFLGGDLVLFSKFPKPSDPKLLLSFIHLRVPISRLKAGYDQSILSVSFSGSVNATDMKSGSRRDVSVSFTFTGRKHITLTKKELHRSDVMSQSYGEHADERLASADIAGYVVSVPHFAPHPYLFNMHKELGFPSRNAMLQETNGFIMEHLGLKE